MATLYNTKISATYEGLLKTIDNAAITATLKELTDGSGNQSGLYLNTAGDFKVTSILEWGSLKDTGTGVTITQFVTSTDGIENFDNNTTLPTSAAVKLYVDTKFSITDTLTEVLGFGNTTSGKDIAVSAGDDITFTDSSKILMGSSNDLEIYHDGANSYIKDVGTGTLNLQGSAQVLITGINGQVGVQYIEGGAVNLRHNNVQKLATTNTGATVTGDLIVTGTITGAGGGSFLPLAGGTMTGNIVLNDNVKSIYGTGSDLEIYHDGSNSYIDEVGQGSIYNRSTLFIVQNSDSTKNSIIGNPDADVKLYYNSGKKFETTNTGATITGALTTTTNVTVGANATFVDNGKALFGASSDLQIYHDGNNSYIKDTGTGSLKIQATNLNLQNDAGESYIDCVSDAQVQIYYDNSKKLETTSAGAKVTGNLEVTGTITGSGGSFLPLIGGTMTGDTIHNDNVKSIYGTASDGLEIYHDGSHSYISDTGTGDLTLRASNDLRLQSASTEAYLTCNENGSVEVYYNDALKFETTNQGILVTGNINTTGSISIPDAGRLYLGTNDDAQLYHDGSNGYLKNNTGQLNIDQAAVTESIVFRTSDANALDVTALTINRSGDLITGRDVTIAGDLTVNGTTTTVNSQTLSVDDPLISLAINNSANSLDIGYYGKYNDGTTRYLGLFNDASDSNKFKLFRGTTVEPTTTVNIGGAGYVAADLVVAGLEASTTIGNNKIIMQSNGTLSWGAAKDYGTLSWDTGYALIQGQSGKGLKFETNNGFTALTLNTSQNATFGGNVDADSFDASGKILMGSDGTLSWGAAQDYGKLTYDSGKIIIRSLGGKAIEFQTNGTTETLTLDTSQNATFAGKILAGTGASAQATINAYSTTVAAGLYSALRVIENSGASSYWDIGATGGASTLLNFYHNANTTPKVSFTNTGGATFAGSIISTGSSLAAAPTIPSLIVDYHAPSDVGRIMTGSGGVWNKDLSLVPYGGNVGIGTTTPSVGLQLGNSTSGETKTAIFNSEGGGEIGLTIKSRTNRAKLLVSDNDSSAYVVAEDGKAFFGTSPNGDTANIAVLTSGNVGIGTTAPSKKLDIQAVNEVARFKATGTSSEPDVLIVDADTSNSRAALQVQGNNGATEVLFAASGGNVGIGTTTPSNNLQVKTETNGGGITIQRNSSSASAYADLMFSVSTADSAVPETKIRATRGADYSDTDISFITSNSEAMRITSTGNVGIDNISPSAKLHIGSGSSSLISGSADELLLDGAGNSGLTIGSGAASIGSIFFADSGSSASGILQYNHTDNALLFGTSAAERMRITSGGNVGIGTVTPNYKLSINGDFGVSNGGNIYIGGIGADSVIGYLGNESGVFTLRSDGNRDISIGSGTVNDSIFIEGTNGNVGIGTTSPSEKLSIAAGNILLDNFYKLAFGSVNTSIYGHETQGINFVTDGNSRLKVEDGGNVGIGTTTPTALLDISSTTNGVLLPRMTTTQVNAISSPSNGLTVYNTTLNTLCFYNGTAWQKVTSATM